MEIEIIEESEKFEWKQKIIRDLKTTCDDCEDSFSSKHFQAILIDNRKKQELSVVCRLQYENEKGDFLGLDEDSVYGVDELGEITISNPITIPKNTKIIKVSIRERKYLTATEYTDLLVGLLILLVVSVVAVYAAKGFFSW